MLKNYGTGYSSTKQLESILCAYQNRTSSLQIIKVENFDDYYWEKVVFPYQTILFDTVKQANLTIYSNKNATAILTDTIACLNLQVLDGETNNIQVENIDNT